MAESGRTVLSGQWHSSLYLALQRFGRLPVREQLTTLRILGVVAMVEVMVRSLPLSLVARWLGITLFAPVELAALPCPLDGTARRQILAIERVMRCWSVAPGPCLRQALVLGHVLRRYKPVLHIGVTRRDDAVLAHAWLNVGGISIGGNDRFKPFTYPAMPPGSVSHAPQDVRP